MATNKTQPTSGGRLRELASGLLVADAPQGVARVELATRRHDGAEPVTVAVARLACSSFGFNGSAIIGTWENKGDDGDHILAVHVIGRERLDTRAPFATCSSFVLANSTMMVSTCPDASIFQYVREDNAFTSTAAGLLTSIHGDEGLPAEGPVMHDAYREMCDYRQHGDVPSALMEALEKLDPMSVVNS